MDPGLRSKNLITRMMKDGTELKRGDVNKRTLTRCPRLLPCLKQNKIKQWRVGCGDRACTGGGGQIREGVQGQPVVMEKSKHYTKLAK